MITVTRCNVHRSLLHFPSGGGKVLVLTEHLQNASELFQDSQRFKWEKRVRWNEINIQTPLRSMMILTKLKAISGRESCMECRL